MFTIERPLISLDLETTSKEPREARIIELGMVIVYPDGHQKEFEAFVNPGIPIPPNATAATTNKARPTGITNEMVADAHPFSFYAENLATNFKDADFVGFNVRSYDLVVMHHELVRAGFRDVRLREAKCIDAMRIYHKYRTRTLTDAVRDYLDEEHDGHGALVDARNSLRVAVAMLSKHQLPATPSGIHDLYFGDSGDQIAGGSFIWSGNEVVMNFGKYKGVNLRNVPRHYLDWVANKSDMQPEVKEICKEALNGRYPTRTT